MPKDINEVRIQIAEQEKKKIQEQYEKVRNALVSDRNGKHNENYIARQLHEKESLRKVYLSLIKFSPGRISEISEDSLLTKPTCYNQLFKLMSLQLCDRVYVMQVMNGAVRNDEIKEKYTEWVKSMPENLKRYYLAKTSYWVITDFGKKFSERAYKFDNEFRQDKE